MAITTVDGIVAGLQVPQPFFKVGATMEAVGVLHSLFYTTGVPGAATAPSPGINGVPLTTYAGQIPYTNPVSGNGYLAGVNVNATLVGTLLVCDRLWHNSGVVVTTTTAQAITTPTWPARDKAGTTDGDGIMVGIEVSTATTNAGAVTNTTLSYTDQGGTAGNTATITSFPATAVAGTFVPFQLAAGDTGVRAIASVTLGTSYGGGAIHLVAYRVLATIPVNPANAGLMADYASVGFPRLYNDTVPFLLWRPSATTAVTVQGEVLYAHG